jgi:hypothetical protein
MLIFEVEDSSGVDTSKLIGVVEFLISRAEDTNAKKQISTQAFINLAKGQGVNITKDTLGDLISKEPLSNLLEPYDPNSNVVRFKGNDNPSNMSMNPDQAQQVVSQNAKAAMKRGMSK